MLARPSALLAVALALGAMGCQSRGEMAASRDGSGGGAARTGPALAERPLAYRVVWASGKGRVGYVETREMARGPDRPVTRHVAMDLEFVEVGWYTDAGDGVRYDYPQTSVKSAFQEQFLPETLPVDTLDNQVRRIFRLDPTTPITLVRATEADLRR